MADQDQPDQGQQDDRPVGGQQSGVSGESPGTGAIILRHSLPGRAFRESFPTRSYTGT